jgi:hypothetical protein
VTLDGFQILERTALRYENILPVGNSDDVGGRRAVIGSSSSFIDNTTSCNTECVTIRSHTVRRRADGERCGNAVPSRCAVG